MKKLNSFFLMGSVALAGLGVMSSCSSDDLGTDSTNITDNKAVKTQFALNIPRANGGTRMSADNTQGETGSAFLGMKDILLYSFSEEPGVGKTSTSLIRLTDLGNSDINSSKSAKIYNDVAIPVGTTHFLFYGHAPQGTEEDVANAANFTKGVLTFTSDDAVNNIKAELKKAKGTDETSVNALESLLNGVIEVNNWKSKTPDTELGKLYNKFTNLKAGSANSIRLALQSLYNNVGSIVSSTDEETKTIAKAIRTEIEKSFEAEKQSDNSYTLEYKPTFKGNKEYPNNINLPDGAVQVAFEANQFSYAKKSSLTGLRDLDASNICFPSSIYYFCSSDLAATADELQSWPKTTSKWTTPGNAPWLNTDGSGLANGWTGNVQATTRSIAMRQNINYGVASLKTTVKCEKTRLYDNKNLEVFHKDEFTGFVDVPEGGFKVTGLLIGGQPTEVGFNFQPKATSEFTYTIYDKILNNIKATTTGSNANYTIVLPNDKGRDEATQEKVNVAIELENNSGADFRGADGIVPDGGKFYLVGQLKPGEAKNLTGMTITNPAVFMSDYQTTLSLNIKSLASAYNTIPDLRSTKLQFGMSVDLEWKTGLQFDIDIP